MPTLNTIRDQVRELIREKEWPLNTERALWRGMIEFGEASDIYLKTGLEGYWNKRTHKPVTDDEISRGAGLSGDLVLAKDAYLEELIDVVFFVVNATHVECEGADLDKVFRDKLAHNFTRPKLYGVSDKIKAEVRTPLAENTKKMDAKRIRGYGRGLSAREMKSIAWGENNGA